MLRLRGLLRWPALLVVAGAMAAPIPAPAAGGPPAGQDDLGRWTDMVTINTYPGVNDGEGLADVANRALANDRRSGATVLRTASRPAEHLIVALFPTGAFVEAVFARWRPG